MKERTTKPEPTLPRSHRRAALAAAVGCAGRNFLSPAPVQLGLILWSLTGAGCLLLDRSGS